MAKLYQYFTLAGLIMATAPVLASGVPVYSTGEVVNMAVDQFENNNTRGLIDIHNELVQSALDAVGGPNSFSVSSFKKNLKKTLTEPSKAISGYDGLQTLLGADSEFGEIRIKKCGGNLDEVVDRLDETVVYPALETDGSGRNGGDTGTAKSRLAMTEEQRTKMEENRAEAMERAATSGLAKAWTVQSETSKVAEAISDTQKELDNAESQLAVMATILRLQEETQKNLNTRLSIMSDDLVETGLSALDANR